MNVGSEDQFGSIIEQYLDTPENDRNLKQVELLASHPEFEARLRTFFANFELLNRPLDDATTGAASSAPAQEVSQLIDDVFADCQIPGFRIIQELGSGSQGIVYQAEQVSTKRVVALKVFRNDECSSLAKQARAQREVELAARLRHPNIVQIFTSGRFANCDYYAMEYIEGEPLDAYSERVRSEVRTVLERILPVIDAVAFAHQRGVIHGDLKPSNIVIDATHQPHILDFGLAKAIAPSGARELGPVTRVGEFAGTWFYASPEQTLKEPSAIDVRSEVYSLGVIIFELLTNRLPYPIENETHDVIAERIRKTPAASARALRREIDHDLDMILNKTLAKEPEQRYQSADQLAAELRRYLSGEPVEARQDQLVYLLRKALRRHRTFLTVGSLVFVALVAFSTVISVLYAKLVAANATQAARTEIGRATTKYIATKLNSLQRADRLVGDLNARFPDVAEEIGAFREINPDLLNQLRVVAAQYPQDMASGYDFVGHSVLADEPAMATSWNFARALRRNRIGFPARTDGQENLISSDWHDWGMTANACAIGLATVSWRAFEDGDEAKSIDCLTGLRLLAMDFAEGQRIADKRFAFEFRILSYRVLQSIIRSGLRSDRSMEPYLDWLLADAPLPPLRSVFVTERLKWSQVCEAISKGDAGSREPIIDWHELKSFAGDLLPSSGSGLDESIRLPTLEVIALVDRYLSEVQTWDDLQFDQIAERKSAIRRTLQEELAFEKLPMLFPDYCGSFRLKLQVASFRAVTGLAAQIAVYRQRQGRWPATLEELESTGHQVSLIDPSSGRSFGYKVTAGGFRLLASEQPETLSTHDQLMGGPTGDGAEPLFEYTNE